MPSHYKIFSISCRSGNKDLLIAELAGSGIDSFVETEDGFQIYLNEESPEVQAITNILKSKKERGILDYTTASIEEKNWNAVWENSYDPVIIKDRFLIRSAFHQPVAGYPIEIIINPKMSFGTGHHDTTVLMIEMLLEADLEKKDVLDAGCGTGILSIAAEKSGARSVTGYDIDPNAVRNALENIDLNGCNRIQVLEGDASIIPSSSAFHFILANITRNIILEDISLFSQWLLLDGSLILSGFYKEDTRLIGKAADKHDLSLQKTHTRNNWAVMVFQKKSP